MTDYKLCEQLKNVGYSFKTTTIKNGMDEIALAIPTLDRVIKYLDTNLEIVKFREEWFFVPITDDIIKACGNSFDSIYRSSDGYRARGFKNKFLIHSRNSRTSLEAMISLYIRLNK